MFDRFFRGQNAEGRQGSGLGLAIVRQVAEQHGGSVEVTNAPGGGADFRLLLPTIDDDQVPDESVLGGGRASEASLSGGSESPSEQPVEDAEHGRSDAQQERRTIAVLADQRNQADREPDRGDPRQ